MTDPQDPRPPRGTSTPKPPASAGSSFDLRALVREVCESSSNADPGALADEVFPRIPRKSYGDALQQTLRGYVRLVVASYRSPEPDVSREDVGPAELRVKTKPGSRSWKRIGIRHAHQSRLRDRLHVGPDAWKMLGACTYDDLMFVADERRHLAEQTLARAAFYEGLADLVKDHAVSCVEELPEEVLSSHLGDEGETE